MNDGVKILLERMKTHPEEFVDQHWGGESKWGRLIDSYRPYLTKEDLEVFDAAYKDSVFKLMQQRFTEDVMEQLIDPPRETKDWVGKVMDSHGLNSKGTTWGRLQV
jgi:NTP pyrophosphatase (non-canonical NTP hydrolase)